MFIVLTLQRLMKLDVKESEEDHETIAQKFRRAILSRKTSETLPTVEDKNSSISQLDLATYRTLQDYNGGDNEERTDYMESQSMLKAEGLEVSVEQVSIFITSGNEIISFFESSGRQAEEPLMKRLLAETTILRQSEDATLLFQAIMDAIVDLAFPVNMAFKNAIDQMELGRSTFHRNISHSRLNNKLRYCLGGGNTNSLNLLI